MGGASSATKQQQQVNLEASKQQLAFNTQLMDLFKQQFASQQNQLQFLQGVLQPTIKNAQEGNGFTPEQLAAMRTSATDTLSGQFQSAQQALNQQLRTSGDANVPSGVTVGANADLFNQEAIAKAGAQNQITLANAQQAQNNLWNSVNALNGLATEANPLGYAGAATSGSGTIAGLSSAQSNLQNAISNAKGFFGKLGSSFATGLGGGLANAFTGGIGMALPFANPF